MEKEFDFAKKSEKVCTLKNSKEAMMLSRMIIVVMISFLGFACSQPQNTGGFNASALSDLGDSVHYGSYIIYKIGDGVYKICDPGTPGLVGGGLVGVDMYIIRGKDKVILYDLGNNYIRGYEKDLITPRENAKEEFLDVVDKLVGGMPLEVVISHAAPDHSGMAEALLDRDIPLWIGEGEDLERIKAMHGVDPSEFQVFRQGEKTFDLGGGRTLETFLVRGHSEGETVLLLKPDMMLFTGDAISPGPRRKRELRTAEQFDGFTEDMNNLVGYIMANLAPYDRYRMQVYTGHSAEMLFHKTKTDVEDKMLEDALYAEWRFVQDMANVANAIKDGSWLDETQGFHHFEVAPGRNGEKQIQIIYYLGALILPEDIAYGASGMKAPETAGSK